MKWLNRIAYGGGQVQKDLVAAVLNIFAIVYLEDCLRIPRVHVGSLWLCGQVVNAISTPLIGFLSDRAGKHTNEDTDNLKAGATERYPLRQRVWEEIKARFNLSNRKAWHLYGSLLMTVSLPSLFGQPEQFAYMPLWAKFLINGSLLAFVQIGWAAVQIAHLTLINYLTSDPNERVLLVSLRYFFGSVGDISTFIMSYILMQPLASRTETTTTITTTTNKMDPLSNLTILEDGVWSGENATTNETINRFTTADMPFFRTISAVLILYGLFFVMFFQYGVPDRAPEDELTSDEENECNYGQLRKRCIQVHGSKVYLSPFLLYNLKLEKSTIVLVPLVIYGSSLVTALVQHRMAKLTGRLGNTLIGMICTLTFCIVMFFYQPTETNFAMIYGAAVFLGIGSAFNNVTAIVTVSDMIGTTQLETAAFVQGFASLMDKICTGLSVQFIQLALPRITYRHVEVFITGGCLLFGGSLCVLDSLWQKREKKRSDEKLGVPEFREIMHDVMKDDGLGEHLAD